jgi:hypothetical protein
MILLESNFWDIVFDTDHIIEYGGITNLEKQK